MSFFSKFLSDFQVISVVGGGGKTSTLFHLAEEFCKSGKSVAITTTTHIFDPRNEENRFFEKVVFQSDEIEKNTYQKPVVFASKYLKESGKLKGVSKSFAEKLEQEFDVVLIEADGALKKPIKAHAAHEPVIAQNTQVVIGVFGLDILGTQLCEENVFRSEIFEKITSCKQGEKITVSHIIKLIKNDEGLFKNAPNGAKKILLANKLDMLKNEELYDVKSEIKNANLDLDLIVFSSIKENRYE
jgi:probable selenium-dependent hydroxylase accessory protein YqeC